MVKNLRMERHRLRFLGERYPIATVLAESRLHPKRSPLEAMTSDLSRAAMVKTSDTPHLGAFARKTSLISREPG